MIEIQIAEPLLSQENQHVRNELRINYAFVVPLVFIFIFYCIFYIKFS